MKKILKNERHSLTVAEFQAAAKPSNLLTGILKKMSRRDESKIHSHFTKRDKAYSRLGHQVVGAETL